ncbi:hypothetical protein LTR84_007298 [Exophiala bonariae]|uniref:Uncharacterized protein n=1 Tax=Exophiala bonariae TaxID=1690606 RepID=A0AAV9N295_9EURO|nr:hypothetical protein LTR84_007298 [Exophiala bonariae]
MDLFLHVGPLMAHPTHTDDQTDALKHSRAFTLSHDETLPVNTSQPTTHTASVPTLRRTRRLIASRPNENPLNARDLAVEKNSQSEGTSVPVARRNASGKALHMRATKPLYPPSSWKGDISNGRDDGDIFTKSSISGSNELFSSKTGRSLPSTNHVERYIGKFMQKLPEESTDECNSSGEGKENLVSSAKPLLHQNTSGPHTKPCNTPRDRIMDPKPSAPKIGSDWSKASSRAYKQSSRNGATTQSVLPDPEVAYSQTFYYTTCPHTSPPCSRPLNVQPTLTTYHENLLRFAPFHLRIHPMDPAPEIYTLEGACSQCDLAARREAEIKVLGKYKSKVDDLSARLHDLQGDIDLDSPTLPRKCYGGTSQSSPHSKAMTDQTNAVFTPEAIEEILSIETDLESLIKRRDREVKFIWRGYTARWGPATLGVFRDQLHPLTRTMQTAATSNAEHGLSRYGTASDDESITSTGTRSSVKDVGSGSSGASSTTSFGSGGGATHSSSTRTRRTQNTTNYLASSPCDTPQSRYSNGMRHVPLPSPIDATKQDGRMQIGWVRQDRNLSTKTPRNVD